MHTTSIWKEAASQKRGPPGLQQGEVYLLVGSVVLCGFNCGLFIWGSIRLGALVGELLTMRTPANSFGRGVRTYDLCCAMFVAFCVSFVLFSSDGFAQKRKLPSTTGVASWRPIGNDPNPTIPSRNLQSPAYQEELCTSEFRSFPPEK